MHAHMQQIITENKLYASSLLGPYNSKRKDIAPALIAFITMVSLLSKFEPL